MVRYLVDILPSIEASYPEWFLPSTVIVRMRKQDWNSEFEKEKRIYHHLKALQGTVIPIFYGEATYDRSPAFVLSKIHGQRLFDTDFGSRLEADDPILGGKLEEAFKALTEYGVIHGDPGMHNLFEVEDRVMIVDFEQAKLGSRVWKGNVNYLMSRFREARRGWEYSIAENQRWYEEIMRNVQPRQKIRSDIEIIDSAAPN
jgi:predicted Ser/Thr protein kinase